MILIQKQYSFGFWLDKKRNADDPFKDFHKLQPSENGFRVSLPQDTSPAKAKMIEWMSRNSLFKSFILCFMYENCVK